MRTDGIRMRRVAIIGSSGSGKSTLAVRLGKITGLPVVHIDAISWLPNWVERDHAELDRILVDEIARDRWIIDGNYSRTMPARLAAADTVIWLDFSRWVCLWRVVKRRIMYHNQTRPDLGGECKEKLDWEFLAWVWNYPTRSRGRTIQRLCDARHSGNGKTIVRFTSPRQVEPWLRRLRAGGQLSCDAYQRDI
jgi:adenylate kinase family enzyme